MELGQTPMWVMENFTSTQLMFFYGKIKKCEFEFAELQARLVWAIANGWKRPKLISVENVNDLRATGMFKEG